MESSSKHQQSQAGEARPPNQPWGILARCLAAESWTRTELMPYSPPVGVTLPGFQSSFGVPSLPLSSPQSSVRAPSCQPLPSACSPPGSRGLRLSDWKRGE